MTRDVVILLHGLLRSQHTMRKLHRMLVQAGYRVYNFGYPSTRFSISQLTDRLHQFILKKKFSSDDRLYFVGHSLGAIIIRALLTQYTYRSLARVVMLAPPNQGSMLVDYLKRYRFYRILGPAAQELGTDLDATPLTLPELTYETGIIAGDCCRINFLFSWFILSGPNDGMVRVIETRMPNATDFLLLHTTHSAMPRHPLVMAQTLYFLKYGYFKHQGSSTGFP